MMFDDFEDLDDLQDDDGASTSDGAEGVDLLEPRLNMECFGHDDIERQLLELFNAGRMPHGLVFAGPKGIGKATFAYRLARFLLKHGKADVVDAGPSLFGDPLPATPVVHETMNVDAEEQAVRLIASGGHPDLLTIERAIDEKTGARKEGVSVDDARKVTPFLRMTASMGGWRVVILDDADTMNRSSQNAILKILEEPPSNTVLILIAHRPGALIPTIRSRTRFIEFNTLDDALMARLLTRVKPDIRSDECDVLCAIAQGSIGQALNLMDEEGLKAMDRLVAVLQNWPNLDWKDIHHVADYFGQKGQENAQQSFQDILLWIVSTMVKARARGVKGEGGLPRALSAPVFGQILRHYNVEQWVGIYDALLNHFATVKYGTLDRRYAAFGAFSILSGAEQK